MNKSKKVWWRNKFERTMQFYHPQDLDGHQHWLEFLEEIESKTKDTWEAKFFNGNYYRKMPDGTYYSINSLSEGSYVTDKAENALLATKETKKKCENCEMKPGKVIRVDDIYAKDMKCADCGKKLKSFEVIQDTKPSPQPEIEKIAENDGEWCTGGKVSITYGQREEMLREKVNEVIDQLNKSTKTK